MREGESENSNEMCNQGKKTLKKYYSSFSISNQIKTVVTSLLQLMPPIPETFFASVGEYKTYVAWKQKIGAIQNKNIPN